MYCREEETLGNSVSNSERLCVPLQKWSKRPHTEKRGKEGEKDTLERTFVDLLFSLGFRARKEAAFGRGDFVLIKHGKRITPSFYFVGKRDGH